jgi:ribosomal protein S13
MDFTDPDHPMEIGYFDRGPVDPKVLVSGGSWSAYWYNGRIYSSEIARGLDIFELTPTEHLTQNEIDAARSVHVAELNVQNQQRLDWPRKLVVAKAYIDQLERSGGMSSEEIASLRDAIKKAEGSRGQMKKLKGFAASVEKSAGQAKSSADSSRLTALAEILKRPEA